VGIKAVALFTDKAAFAVGVTRAIETAIIAAQLMLDFTVIGGVALRHNALIAFCAF
jgi:hypothetical protein